MGQLINIGGGAIMLVVASQFPEFSQQYVQRLGGAVDELRLVVADFDASASKVGLSRDAALDTMTGNSFQKARQADMSRSFTRLDRLETDFAALKDADAFSRVAQVTRLGDTMIAQRAWQDFKPAVPLSFEGLVFAAGGFATGFLVFVMLGLGIGRLFRRRKSLGMTERIMPAPPAHNQITETGVLRATRTGR
jgi:hypothetical protein